ncbi:MAG TPA: dihydroneopterin aldolase [Salinisphaeraceae bacterium]|nr:dihydroneopterin aldolase [Salinisphaeraceae bacterium]
MSQDHWSIRVPDIKVPTYIGVYDWEHEQPQTLNVALALVPAQAPAGEHYLDYAAVVIRVRAFARRQPRRLLEEFAGGLADELWQEFDLRWLQISVTKSIDIEGMVSPTVTLERR